MDHGRAGSPAVALVLLIPLFAACGENRDDAGARQPWARALAILEANELADPGRLVELLHRLAGLEPAGEGFGFLAPFPRITPHP